MLRRPFQSFNHLSSQNSINLKKVFSAIRPFLLLGLVLFAISGFMGLAGGINEYSSALRVELPYLVLVYAALLYLMRPGILRAVVAAVPIIIVYTGMDLYYIFMHSVPKLDDLLLLPEGLNVSPVWVRVGSFTGVTVWIALFVFLFKRHLKELVIPLGLLALAAVPPLSAYTMPKQFLHVTEELGIGVIPWSDRWTSAVMGRVTSLLLFAATKQKALDEITLLPIINDPEQDPDLIKKAMKDDRNVHIVVLESFLDPKRFTALKFRTPPNPPRFSAFRKKMHISVSPVFGGGTAQAEFEVLCGVPALKLYTSAEFNMLDGSPTACLPRLLADIGYRTVATQSYRPEFFNSENAYLSLGFQEINFPSVFAGNRPTYLKYDEADKYIFDGDLFSQNLTYVRKLLSQGKPFLNYVLGIYGHLPHEIDPKRFPPMVDVSGVDKKSLTYRAIQQFYYRAGALADYLRNLRKIDPNGLILVTSDHLPPLDRGPNTYEKLGYSLRSPGGDYNRNVWIYDGPTPKKLAWPDHYYEFMDFILDVLTQGRICKQVACKNRKPWSDKRLTADYNSIMAQGSGVLKKKGSFVAASPAPAPAAALEKPHLRNQPSANPL